MDEIVKDFLIESNENLDRLDQELVKLESDPSSQELLASVFRTIHTIKGSCGFLGFARLEKLAHAGESLLSRLRDGKITLNAEITSGLLAMVDAVRRMLASIQASDHDGDEDYAPLIEQLAHLQKDQVAELSAESPGKSAETPPPAETVEAPKPQMTSEPSPTLATRKPRRNSKREKKLLPARDEAVALEHGEDPRSVGDSAPEKPPGEGLSAGNTIPQAAAHPEESRNGDATVETIRVGVTLLDRLMNLVGELVLARNQLLQFSNTTSDAGFQAVSQRMNLIATELQEEVMKTRMQPIGNVWNKFPRTVRDLALGCGKEVRLEMEGQDTELDRTIIEAIKDPLTHLLRNSMDHGIESPEARKLAGKDPAGVLTLRAFHEGGQVNIEITDDGAGLNGDRIRQKAIERGLISAQQAANMPDRDVFNLIFLPGFSTAEKVTKVSGRGVGMDVVKTNVEKIGGTVDIQSTAGRGTTVRVRIPLTLAIIPALIATCGGERFAIPQVSLIELVRLEGNKGIEMVHGAPVYRLRGRLLPLVYLSRTLAAAVDDGLLRTTSRNELPDFALARDKHHQWVSRLRSVLDGTTSMTVEQAGSPRECALGKWLYASGLKDYKGIPEMHSLEQAHRQFHDAVPNVVISKVNGDDKQAQLALDDVARFSERVLELLTTVEARAFELQNVNIVVLQAEGRQFGLVVDDILDTQEIVVKPLGKQLKGINAYSGATIMGDGKVALILDVSGLAQRAKVITEEREPAHDEAHSEAGAVAIRNGNALLLAENGTDGRVAIPLSMVARLEEFPRTMIEHAGTQAVMQYRGQIIPLVRLSQIIAANSDAEMLANAPSIQVVVYSEGDRTVGLIVDRIVDIVDEQTAVESLVPRAGVVGSFVSERHVTDLLDVPAIVRAAVPGLLDGTEAEAGRA
jgi:chemotaxis protein histidine kinase CheA